MFLSFKVYQSWHISLFVFSGSVNKLFSIDCVKVYFCQYFFQQILRWKSLWLLHIAPYRDSLTISTSGDSQYTYTPITTLSTCACSRYIKDNSRSKVPGHSVNISKIYHDLRYLIIQSIHAAHSDILSICADCQYIEDTLLP